MLNGLAKLSFPTMAGDSTLRELTWCLLGGGGRARGDAGLSADWQNAGPPPLGVLLAGLRTWPCVLLGRTHFK